MHFVVYRWSYEFWLCEKNGYAIIFFECNKLTNESMRIAMSEEFIQKISDAELVLVGIGEELEIGRKTMEKNDLYARAFEQAGEDQKRCPYIEKHFFDRSGDEAVLSRKSDYSRLAGLLEGKNYFVVTLCTDGLIHGTGFDEGRIVEPCGNMEKMQCADKCTPEIYDRKEEVRKLGEMLLSGREPDDFTVPSCPLCGKELVFNNISAENYAEEGYLERWASYTKWLQGTVNRRVCMVELGVGMRFPTVIRWPFEKIVYFNQKAFLFRIHSRLYQTAQEIKERSRGIQASVPDFLKALSNEA